MTSTTGQSVLVTGASGFIGGQLVRRLTARGCQVSCLVRATSRVDGLRAAGARLVACEIADRAGIARAIASSNARFVFHLAGRVRALGPEDFMRANAGGVEAVAQACTEQPDPPVLVLVSSLAAAGPSRERPVVESDPPAPVSHYGRSKFAGEQAAIRYADALPVTVVRPCIVFGAGDRGMLEVFRPIARSGLHAVGGTGDHGVSLVAVADLVECLVLAAEQGERLVPGIPGQGIYFAAAEDVSYVELGMAIARALGEPPPRVLRLPRWSLRTIGLFGDVVSQFRRHPGWVGRDKVRDVLAGSWTCSSAKAKRQLGWSPAAPLADRLREAAQWYRDAHWL
ncbi:MAG: NAD-dependent epimerase/dehydratase family protein [Betaproteobacteria bacterium]